MTTLLKNGKVVNVFTDEIEQSDVLICDGKIIGVGRYDSADIVEDLSGKFVCPSFIDGHIHIESSMLLPKEFARECIPHGTCAVVADPHEIANVCGTDGVNFMIEASANLPMKFYFSLPSCVPATPFDENGAVLTVHELEPLYSNERVICLGEMMNYPAVINSDETVMEKLRQAQRHGKIINGHAPLLSEKDLDKYISAGVNDDHECTFFDEAVKKLKKGMWIMIREGTSARNLTALLKLFDEPYSRRCILVTDDKHAYDLLNIGHIDYIIRKAVRKGKSALTGIRMATIQAAQCFHLRNVGAVAPNYAANLLVLSSLDDISIDEVYYEGVKIFKEKLLVELHEQNISRKLLDSISNSFFVKRLQEKDFHIDAEGTKKCRVIQLMPGSLLTNELICDIDFSKNNGVDTQKDLVKIAVCERHKNTGHIALGFVSGAGITKGAIASSISHDSHNLIIVGTSESDMTMAGNTVAETGGGICAVCDGRVIAKLELPIAGLMSDKDAVSVTSANEKVRAAARSLGNVKGIEPFMHMAFASLPVIPNLRIITNGIIDVNKQKIVSLFVEE